MKLKNFDSFHNNLSEAGKIKMSGEALEYTGKTVFLRVTDEPDKKERYVKFVGGEKVTSVDAHHVKFDGSVIDAKELPAGSFFMKTAVPGLTDEQVAWCNSSILNTDFDSKRWGVDKDGRIKVSGKFMILDDKMEEFPVTFGVATGLVDVRARNLKTFKGMPISHDDTGYYGIKLGNEESHVPAEERSLVFGEKDSRHKTETMTDFGKKYLESGLTFKQFIDKYKGTIQGKNYGL